MDHTGNLRDVPDYIMNTWNRQSSEGIAALDSSFLTPSSMHISSPFPPQDSIESEPTKLPYYSLKSLAIQFESVESVNGFKAHNLLSSADQFVKVAHGITIKVHSSEATVIQYYKLVKAAIACLLVVTKKYMQQLSVELQISVHLRLAQLYLFETKNSNLAEDAINKAVSISTRSGSIRLKFQAEYLYVQMLFVNNPKLGLKYLNTKIEEYNKDPVFGTFVTLFDLLKLKYILVLEPNYAHSIAERLSQDHSVDPLTRQLILSYHVSFLLVSKDFDKLESVLNEFEQIVSIATLPQLEAIYFFHKIWLGVLKDDLNLTKRNISKMDNFIKREKSKGWQNWTEDGSFTIVSKSTSHGIELSYRVCWLNGQEVLFMLYFIAGLAYLPKSFDEKGRSLKFFEGCWALIDSQLSLLKIPGKGLSLVLYENAILRLRFLKIYLNYFLILARFNSDQWDLDSTEPAKEIFKFIDLYDNGQLSSQELLLYHKLIPHILYMLGVYHHCKQDFHMAKYYYNRIRSHLRKSSIDLPPESRFMNDPLMLSLHQIELGVGPDSQEKRSSSSELYIFASLNLLTILSSEIKSSNGEGEFLLKSSIKKDILFDLNEFLDIDKSSPLISDSMLNITIRLFRILYESSSLSENSETINSLANKDTISSILKSSEVMSEITSNYPLLATIVFYISSYCIQDSTIKLKNLQKSYYHAKLTKNLKLLSLTAFRIYELMKQNNGDIFSIEEINDQKLKYMNYFEMFQKRYGLRLKTVNSIRVSETGSEEGLYDNEKNDDYYDKTAGDISLISTT